MQMIRFEVNQVEVSKLVTLVGFLVRKSHSGEFSGIFMYIFIELLVETLVRMNEDHCLFVKDHLFF